MKYLKTYQLFESKTGLTKDQEWVLRFVDGSWSYDPATGLVNVEGDGDYKSRMVFDEGSTENFSGVKFGKVTGFFDCSNNRIADLDGCPQEVVEISIVPGTSSHLSKEHQRLLVDPSNVLAMR